jgi:hypothetical protein
MKKYLLSILLFIFSIGAYSQQKWNYGFKFGGGITYQGISNKDIISTNSIVTLSAAGFVNYNLPYQWAIQSGLGINNKGAEIVEDGITTTPKITYLNIPLNIVKKFSFPGLGMYYLGAGGYMGYAFSGRYKFETPNSVTSEKLEFGNNGDVQKLDQGLNFTTGLELNNHLLFDVRYELGLKDISTSPQKDTGTNYIHNRLLTVSLGYIFH